MRNARRTAAAVGDCRSNNVRGGVATVGMIVFLAVVVFFSRWCERFFPVHLLRVLTQFGGESKLILRE